MPWLEDTEAASLEGLTIDEEKRTLLPSYRVGVPFKIRQADGAQLYVSLRPADDGESRPFKPEILCPHGETASTIRSWIAGEKLAAFEGRPLPPRGGAREWSTTCGCQTTDGMQCSVPESTRPAAPDNLYEFLAGMDGMVKSAIFVRGSRAYRLPYRKGAFLTAKGKVCCAHGSTRRALIERRRRGTSPTGVWRQCECVLDPIPYRAGSSCLKLGPQACKACDRESV